VVSFLLVDFVFVLLRCGACGLVFKGRHAVDAATANTL
jgi:hypothetical protein